MLPLAHKLKFVVAKIYGKTITKIEFAINFKVVFFSLSTKNRSVPIDTAGSVICFLHFFFCPFFILFSFFALVFLFVEKKIYLFPFSERGKRKCNEYLKFSKQQYEHNPGKMVRTSTKKKKTLCIRVSFEKCLPSKICLNLGICL